MDDWDAFRDRSYDWLNTVVYHTRWGNIINLHLMTVLLGLLCVAYHYATMGWRGIIFGTLGYILIAMIVFWFIVPKED
jgi:hypothetical protein